MNKLLLICLGLLGIAGVAIFIFRVPLSSVLFFGLVLACPLMHVFMHGGHGEHTKTSNK
jgi:hypothetical protein